MSIKGTTAEAREGWGQESTEDSWKKHVLAYGFPEPKLGSTESIHQEGRTLFSITISNQR